MRVPALIQARMPSPRLPGKVLRTLGKSPVLEYVIRNVQACGAQPVVCTSSFVSDDPIAKYCKQVRVLCIRGPVHDVFTRFQFALHHPQVVASDWFFRVAGDCPLLSPTLCQALWDAKTDDDDFLGIDQSQVPAGISAELINRARFLELSAQEISAKEREHATLHLCQHPARFRARRIMPPTSLAHPEIRLTIDSHDDFDVLAAIYGNTRNLTAEKAIQSLLRSPQETVSAACSF